MWGCLAIAEISSKDKLLSLNRFCLWNSLVVLMLNCNPASPLQISFFIVHHLIRNGIKFLFDFGIFSWTVEFEFLYVIKNVFVVIAKEFDIFWSIKFFVSFHIASPCGIECFDIILPKRRLLAACFQLISHISAMSWLRFLSKPLLYGFRANATICQHCRVRMSQRMKIKFDF